MKIYLIMGQYHCDYPGQYAPNVMSAWDEYMIDSNEEGYHEDVKKYKDLAHKGKLTDVKVMIVEVPDAAVDALFEPPVVKAKAVGEER
jgi:hypothetical protein